jgi:hypothetical protein
LYGGEGAEVEPVLNFGAIEIVFHSADVIIELFLTTFSYWIEVEKNWLL